MRILAILFYAFLLSACASSIPLKKVSQNSAEKIEITTLEGNYNLEHFHTKSKVKVYELPTIENGVTAEKLSEDKLEEAFFKLNRSVMDVDGKQKIQYKHWISHLKGEVDLTSMGFPPVGTALYSIVDKSAAVLAVKDFPMESIFYMPRIPLSNKPVKPGDSWQFVKQWRSLKTGWPFIVNLYVTLEDWYSCGGLNCAHITYKGAVILPAKNPISSGKLVSNLEGEFVYAPVGDQFLWTASKNSEIFINKDKRVEVDSCVTSYQVQPDKTRKVFQSKFRNFCSK